MTLNSGEVSDIDVLDVEQNVAPEGLDTGGAATGCYITLFFKDTPFLRLA